MKNFILATFILATIISFAKENEKINPDSISKNKNLKSANRLIKQYIFLGSKHNYWFSKWLCNIRSTGFKNDQINGNKRLGCI